MAHSMIEYLNDSSDSGATSCWKPNTALHENQAFTHLLPESHRKRSPVSTGQVHVSPDGTHHFTGVLMISVRQAVSVWSDWPRRRAIDRQQLTWHEGAARARSSVVRAFASHARGRRFNPCRAHHCLATHTPFFAWCPHHCFAWAAPGSTPGSRLHSLLPCAADCCRKPQVAQWGYHPCLPALGQHLRPDCLAPTCALSPVPCSVSGLMRFGEVPKRHAL